MPRAPAARWPCGCPLPDAGRCGLRRGGQAGGLYRGQAGERGGALQHGSSGRQCPSVPPRSARLRGAESNHGLSICLKPAVDLSSSCLGSAVAPVESLVLSLVRVRPRRSNSALVRLGRAAKVGPSRARGSTRGFPGRDGSPAGGPWCGLGVPAEEEEPAMTTVQQQTVSAIRPFHVKVSRRGARRPAPPPRGDPLAQRGARRRSVAGRAAGDAAGARPLLGDRLRPAPGRGEAQRAAAVHHRDRRGATSTSSTSARSTRTRCR